MSCDICGRSSCAAWLHPLDEQSAFESVIEAFERARELREELILAQRRDAAAKEAEGGTDE